MNWLKPLVISSGLLLSVESAAQAQMFLFAEDEASITVRKTLLEDGSFEFESAADTPELLDINYVFCQEFSCSFEVVLKVNGPVDMTGYNIHQFTPYAYAGITSPDVAINLDLFAPTEVLLANAYTMPSTNPDQHAEFVPISRGNASTSVTDSQSGFVTIRGFFELFDLLPGETTQYQTMQIVGSGIQWSPLQLSRDFTLAHSTNKGTTTITPVFNGYEWKVDGWKDGTGHFASMNFLTNGDSASDAGRNLTGYNWLELTMSCQDTMVVEGFFGFNTFDSSQQFLQDIQCDGDVHTYTWDISGSPRTDIQTGLWLHIPIWKNTHLAQAESLGMKVHNVRFIQ